MAGIELCPFLMVPFVGLQCVTVIFSGHTHLAFGQLLGLNSKDMFPVTLSIYNWISNVTLNMTFLITTKSDIHFFTKRHTFSYK